MATATAQKTEPKTEIITTSATPAMKQMRADLGAMETQFACALPPHIPVERFTRVVLTALQNNPKLLACDKQSFFNACMQAAQDGLLPDNREGAIVPFGEDEEGRTRADKAQWMPMTYGIRKKVRNAGVLSDWNCQIVQEGDLFEYELGDNPFIRHKPARSGGRTRKVIAAYSIARFPDGTISREVMNADQLEDIRKKSRAKRGPWSDPVYYPEMCRKTVARLHAKQLPQSTDLDTTLRRDDALYDFAGAREESRRAAPGSARAVLDQFAGGPALPGSDPEPVTPPRPQQEPPREPQNEPPAPESEPRAPSPPGPAPGAPPTNEAEYVAFADQVIAAATVSADLANWWQSPGQRRMRNTCAILRETHEALTERVKQRCAELEGRG